MSLTHATMTAQADISGVASKYVPPHRRGHADGEPDVVTSMSSAAAPFVPSTRPAAPRRDFADLATPDPWTSTRGRGGGVSRGGRRTGGFVSAGDSFAGPSQGRNKTTTGTGWDVRDGRNYRPEPEVDIFQCGKEKSTGINFDSYENIPVEVTGNDTSNLVPIESFLTATDQIHPLLLQNILKVKYERPTPVQKYSIPGILAGRDLMSCAQTGSGKTAAFLFPIITRMLQSGPPASSVPGGARSYSRPAFPVALVLSPTRELAVQIFEEAKKFAYGTGIRPTVVYGGADMRSQLGELERGCDICVATPGRLTDTIERKKVYLQCCKYLVLDEADRMLDMGFSPQIRDIVQKFDMPDTSGGRQTVMFSATFPREIQQLARDFMHDYVFLTVGRVGSTNSFITQNLIYADETDKPTRLLALLKDSTGLVLIFVETKRKADMIEDFLLSHKMPAVSIHGDRSQQEREQALRHFRSGRSPVLVATDVAARGLDIHNITHVINCDLPTHIDDYVHRIGRTGRAGNVGQATSFVNAHSRPLLRDLLGILEESGQDVPGWFMDMVKSCTAAASRFGNSRYGGMRGGRGGRSTNFGARDIRDATEAERRSAAASRGGSTPWRPAPPTGTRPIPQRGASNYPAPIDENDAW